MSYSISQIIDLPESDKRFLSHNSDVRDMTILRALDARGLLHTPITENVMKLLLKTDQELFADLVTQKLNTNITRGQAIEALQEKYLKDTITYVTSEEVTLPKANIPENFLPELDLKSGKVYVPYGKSDIYTGQDILNKVADERFASATTDYQSETTEDLNNIKVSTEWKESSNSHEKEKLFIDLTIREDENKESANSEEGLFDDEYNFAVRKEDEMRDEMYKSDAPEKYGEMYYNLINIDHAPKFVGKPKEEALLFENASLKPRAVPLSISKIFPLYNILHEKKKNVLIAGGAVFHMLYDVPLKDIDIFLIDMTESEATTFVRELLERFNEHKIVRTKNAITISKSQDIQIILRLYKTVSEVLHGFDVDASCMGYHKNKFYITERAQVALKYGVNRVNFNRLSPSYEYRLVKYARKGLSIMVPDFDPKRVRSDRLKEDAAYKTYIRNKANGLSILLFFDQKEKNVEKRIKWSEEKNVIQPITRDYVINVNLLDEKAQSDYNYTFDNSVGVNYEDIMIETKKKASQNFVDRMRQIRFSNFLWEANNKISYISNFKGPVEDFLDIPETVVDDINNIKHFKNRRVNVQWDVPPSIEWKVTNPGEQMTNTFHKIVLNDKSVWYKGVYYM